MPDRFLTLDPEEILDTLVRLEARIEARFPGATLARVTAEVRGLVAETVVTTRTLARPDWRLRLLVGLVLAAALAGVGWLVSQVDFRAETNNLFGMIQSIDALINVTILCGAAAFSLVTIESRVRRDRALKALNPFRSVVHVIDMHQLTKDPSMIGAEARRTDVSPARDLDAFQLSRYLDYCSELLSLTAKAAALTAIAARDPTINTAVNEIEQLTTNLSQKIWQKIMILHSDGAAS